ncbi:AAA family ATPase [Bacillus mojavensis]
MSFLNKLKPNKPTATLEGYFISMLAKSKFGKTTFALDLAEKFYGNLDSTLLLASEIGYKTMDGVYALNITGFDYAEDDEDESQKGFVETVDELIENKADIPFRFIIIDTITALERYAISYVISKANREDQPKKRYTDISDIPWGKGYNMVAEVIYEQIDRLKKNGFGVFIIGHEKNQKVTNRDGFEYDYTTFNVLGKTSNIIEREADMIIYGDLLVEEIKEGEGKSAKSKAVESRKLRFRSDGNILCGTRFRNFPAVIDNDVEVFIETFKNAVLGLYNGDEEALETAKKEQIKVAESKSAKKEESAKEDASVDKLIEAIGSEIEKLPKKSKVKLKLADYFEEHLGDKNYKNNEDAKALAKALKFVKETISEALAE